MIPSRAETAGCERSYLPKCSPVSAHWLMDMFRAQYAEGEAMNKLAQSYGVMPFGITPY